MALTRRLDSTYGSSCVAEVVPILFVAVQRLIDLNGRRKPTMKNIDLTGRDLTVRLVEAMIVTVIVGNVVDRSI